MFIVGKASFVSALFRASKIILKRKQVNACFPAAMWSMLVCQALQWGGGVEASRRRGSAAVQPQPASRGEPPSSSQKQGRDALPCFARRNNNINYDDNAQ